MALFLIDNKHLTMAGEQKTALLYMPLHMEKSGKFGETESGYILNKK
jgi:hypothetical protein